MIKRWIFGSILGALLLGGGVLLGWGLVTWNAPREPEPAAQPTPVNSTVASSTTTTNPGVADGRVTTTTLGSDPTATTTTAPPPPRGDAPVVCAAPVELNIYFSATQADFEKPIPIDVSDTRFYPAENRVDIHVSDDNGLPCADTALPVKLLGHKQHHFCYLVLEDPSFDPCAYGVQLGDLVEVALEDGEIVTYEVVEPLPSEVATPLSEVYPDIKEPTPAVMFRKFTEYQQFYDEVFSREDASDELWLFTSCGNDKRGGHSQDACAVRTEFRSYTGINKTSEGVETD